jgi:fatty-acyl-CoA synthase
MRPIEHFDTIVDECRHRIALIDQDVQLSYEQLQYASYRLAAALLGHQVGGMLRVGVYSPNDYRVIIAVLGIMRAGGVWISVDHEGVRATVAMYLNHTAPSVLFYHSRHVAEIRSIRQSVTSIKTYVCLDAAVDGDVSFDQFMAGSQPDVSLSDDAKEDPTRPVWVRPTGGTTGAPKAVVFDEGAWETCLLAARFMMRCDGVSPVCLSTMPLSHMAGPFAFATTSLGATHIIAPGFVAYDVLETIERFAVTHMILPPSAVAMLLASPNIHDFSYSSLRHLRVTGAPLSPALLMHAVEVFGECVCPVYAQAESGILTWLDPITIKLALEDVHRERLRSCGRSCFGVRLGIMADDGQLLGPGERGEIVARGRSINDYYNDAAKTKDARRFGWHHTGDLGYRDEDGYFYIVGRTRDMIISGGVKVYAVDVEHAIMEIPSIQECAVVGVPHGLIGEAIHAVVCLKSGYTASQDEVISYCRERLGVQKTPLSVTIDRRELPKTSAGKIDKKLILAEIVSLDAESDISQPQTSRHPVGTP